ncbi:stalk domain-containing protein [Paenibacillus mucilaginosus]|uniref:Copper amine oxidase-like N-terminal domain-containing protein n=1 Tax=Paenibacillus mucilaginosus (strain KNP414) TaxID=1036673 RepID=F8FG87_PAEMK|nr:stalk domain-containing protein [Paenibacillus mucilaginosus]AEI43907.1 hypothetical protein KNP414_05383 [Paenibacillus mucilaginosus KNP414]MCG7212589.1 copper amine oxidase N-terminal domain-containing protein [Paenibacillus mucilaginosus]WDM25384.1 copper amine oxidase N-terminal domain-containing protein [Paenibacillus mucilaginosus]
MKRWLAGITLMAALSAGTAASAADSVQAVLFDAAYRFGGKLAQVGGEYVSLNYNGHAYVPIRFIAEQAGLKVEYDESSRTVNVDRAGSYVAEAVALELAKLAVPDAEGVVWKAELVEHGRKAGDAAGAVEGPVWIVTGTDPGGTRTEVVLHAQTGEQIAFKELGVNLPNLDEAYGLVFASLVDGNKEQGGPGAYIAVDPRGLERLEDEQFTALLGKLGEYQVPVLKASLEELKRQGRVNTEGNNAIEGVLLGLEQTKVEGSRLVVDAYLYKTALGAEGRRFVLELQAGVWKLVSEEAGWTA